MKSSLSSEPLPTLLGLSWSGFSVVKSQLLGRGWGPNVLSQLRAPGPGRDRVSWLGAGNAFFMFFQTWEKCLIYKAPFGFCWCLYGSSATSERWKGTLQQRLQAAGTTTLLKSGTRKRWEGLININTLTVWKEAKSKKIQKKRIGVKQTATLLLWRQTIWPQAEEGGIASTSYAATLNSSGNWGWEGNNP